MNIEKVSNDRVRASFKNPDEAFSFAIWGIPRRHFFKYTTLSLRALLSEVEGRKSLSVTLPISSMEQVQQRLSEEAMRLDKVMNSNVDASNKEIAANPDTIATIRELSDTITNISV